MSNLSRGKFMNLLIIYPHEKYLEKFHDATDPIFEKIKILQFKNENLRRTRDLLLPNLISGELNVDNLEINGEAMNS